ncbi:MAG: 1-acyl-sn-glycerol-3-phosphate acyltransferase [Acidobacteria bacterium]|nr:MAG: 1-acyl-sn-glycerol-3-phosphate acyltransferase [Acidobacteriota bacterium]
MPPDVAPLARRKALDALRTLTAVVALAAYILIIGPPLLIWAALFRQAGPLFFAGQLAIRLALTIVGVRIRVNGAEHIQTGRAAVYAFNHSSNLEPPIAFVVLRRLFPMLRVLYKAELRKLPVLVWVFDAAGFVPVQRQNREQSLPAVDKAVDALKAGASFLIFPEGTRSRTGELLPFKKGGVIMALRAEAPVVPVAITGARAAMHRGSPVIHPVTVEVSFCPPIETKGRTFAERDELVEQVRSAIASKL